jgi:threonine dehydratase
MSSGIDQDQHVAAGPLAAGHSVSVQARPTMADGIAVSRPGDIPFGILSRLAERVVTVSEESLSRGLLLCHERAKQVVEPAGAAGVASLLEHPRDFMPPVMVVLSAATWIRCWVPFLPSYPAHSAESRATIGATASTLPPRFQ